MANVLAAALAEVPAESSPELRIPNAAAQTRMVSVPEIQRGWGKFARPFKGIICDVLPPQPRSLVSVGYVWVAEFSATAARQRRSGVWASRAMRMKLRSERTSRDVRLGSLSGPKRTTPPQLAPRLDLALVLLESNVRSSVVVPTLGGTERIVVCCELAADHQQADKNR